MDNKTTLIRDIKYQKFKHRNDYTVLKNLLKKGYTEEEILKEYENIPFKQEWHGHFIGILMIAIALAFVFDIHSTFGFFNFHFRGRGDWFRFNEWVYKPFFILTFLLSGILVLIDRDYFSKTFKYLLFFMALFMGILSGSVNDRFAFALSLFAAILIFFYPLGKNETISPRQILEDIKNNEKHRLLYEKVLKKRRRKKWKGTEAFVLFIFLWFLLYNGSISIQHNVPNFWIKSLIYLRIIMLPLVFVTLLILMFKRTEAKYLLWSTGFLSLLSLFIAFISPGFHTIIYPYIFLAFLSFYLVYHYDLNKRKS